MSRMNRSFKRSDLDIKIKVKESGSDTSIDFQLKDLSEGGIFLTSSILWEPGELFDICILLPNSDYEICTKGEVARSEDKFFLMNQDVSDEPIPGMGIKFLNISDGDRERIKLFLAEL